MKLFYAPGACSLATHIALLEAGFEFDLVRVDLKRKITERGDDYAAINGKGYVPALVLDTGEMITENVAVLDWIAHRHAAQGVQGHLGRTRLLEALVYISTEIHKSFKPLFVGGPDEEKAKAQVLVIKRMHWLADRMQGRYLFGDQPSVADLYLFVTLRWARNFSITIPEALAALHDRLMARTCVQEAIEDEELPALRTGSN